jgi:hypothetical protein
MQAGVAGWVGSKGGKERKESWGEIDTSKKLTVRVRITGDHARGVVGGVEGKARRGTWELEGRRQWRVCGGGVGVVVVCV